MIERHSAQEIGEHGYAYWSRKPVTPSCHEAFFVPQTVMDGWEAYCSCGEWYGFCGCYDPESMTKESTFAALNAAHSKHVLTM